MKSTTASVAKRLRSYLRISRLQHTVTSKDAHKQVFPKPLQAELPKEARSFADLSLHPLVVSALTHTQKTVPTTIQKLSTGPLLAHRHALIAAETGSGKTLAYLAPLLSRLKESECAAAVRDERVYIKGDDGDRIVTTPPMRPTLLVLQPTRELVHQAFGVAKELSHIAKVRVRVAGGGSQRAAMDRRLGSQPYDLLIATPGSVQRLRDRGLLFLSRVTTLVLDEADELLGAHEGDVGDDDDADSTYGRRRRRQRRERLTRPGHGIRFDAQLRPVLEALSQRDVQHIYVGATIPVRMERWIRERHGTGNVDMVRSPRLHRAARSDTLKTTFIRVDVGDDGSVDDAKFHKAVEIITAANARQDAGKMLVFCDGASRRKTVVGKLQRHSVRAVLLAGDEGVMEQREEQWRAFRDGEANVGVCARSFARGINDTKIGTVVLMDVPLTGAEYLHRVGRIRGKGRVYVIVGRKESVVAEAIFLRHVRGENVGAVEPKSAWAGYTSVGHDRLEFDRVVRAARRNGNARWVDERAVAVGTFRGKSARLKDNHRPVADDDVRNRSVRSTGDDRRHPTNRVTQKRSRPKRLLR